MAEDGLDFASDFVSDLPLMGEGSVLADLSEEDLKKAHLKVDLDFQASRLKLHYQDLIKRAEHASARRTQRRYTELRRKQYRQNNAAKELRQQGKYLQEYLLQKVGNAEECDRQQQQLLTATRQSYDLLEQQVQEQAQQIQEQRQHAAEESEVKSAQLAQQAAELAAAKQELATRLAAYQNSERAAKIRSDQLQEQLTQRDTDLHSAEAQCLKLQKDLIRTCGEVTAQKQEQAALRKAHCANLKVAEDMSAQLQQQLAQKGTDLSSAEHELTHLRQALSQTQQSKHEATKKAQKHSAQLQKQLDRKVTEVGSLQQELTSLNAELGRMAKAKEDGLEQMASLRSQLRAALADRDDAIQELTERRNKMEGRAAKAQGRSQGLAARLAASGSSVQSDRSSGPSSPATPPDEPKARSSVFTRLSQVPAPPSQASTHQGTSWSDDDGAEASAPPPGFGPIPSASTKGPKDALQLRSFKEAYCGPKCRLPTVKQMVPRLACLANQLNVLHREGLVHQAVHQEFVLVSPEEDWELAERYNAVPMASSVDKPMVYAGIEAPEMAQQLHKAGYYYPHPKQDMWGFGLLLFSLFNSKGQLPHEHQKAMQEGTTLLFGNKLCGKSKYAGWKDEIEASLKQGQVNLQLVEIVLGCLKKDPEERLTAVEVLAALDEFRKKKGWNFSSTDCALFYY
ncbi:hypothetical protein WJX79_010165 [Trebouxia sp. C0005]